MRAHERPVARHEGTGIEVRFARGAEAISAAVDLLDRAEARVGGPLVDEAERARLDDVTRFDNDPAEHWHPLVAWVGDDPVGYAGLAVGADDQQGVGDIVVSRPDATVVLLDAVRHVAADHARVAAQIWARHVNDAFVEDARAAGWVPTRRLLVLGRSLNGLLDEGQRDLPGEVSATAHDGSAAHDEAVADLLRRAYDGTPDEDWSAAEVARRRGYEWFRGEDLLLAWRGEELLGLHWTKQRDDGFGEVYNLAVAPEAQGLGLGAALLDLGLLHLVGQGCTEIMLWVDASNADGRRLYASRGFEQRWQDVALRCTIC